MVEEQPFEVALGALFGGVATEQQILEAINLIVDYYPRLNYTDQLNLMINYLLAPEEPVEGAVGYTTETPPDLSLYFDKLKELFPQICPDYLRKLCTRYKQSEFAAAVEDLEQNGYVKIKSNPVEIWDVLKRMLPEADPSYLKNHARVLVNRSRRDLEEFVRKALITKNYPTARACILERENRDKLTLYKSKFSVPRYLIQVPNPLEKFLDPAYKSLNSDQVSVEDIKFASNFLYNSYLYIGNEEIDRIFSQHDYHLIRTFYKLKWTRDDLRGPRARVEGLECTNIKVLQEVAFLEHEGALRLYLKQGTECYRLAFEEAYDWGSLQTCGSCYNINLLPNECVICVRGCVFCKDCVQTGCEEIIKRGGLCFPCLLNCGSFISYEMLEMVLDKKLFQILWRRQQINEMRKYDLYGLEYCPHCDFSMVVNENVNEEIFKCNNVDCMKESCRSCLYPAHVPYQCEVVEHEDEVQSQNFIQYPMTEAYLKKCYKCFKEFAKNSGCNLMTCSCGALMCYMCGEPFDDYFHFGEPKEKKCPLYSDNLSATPLNYLEMGAQETETGPDSEIRAI